MQEHHIAVSKTARYYTLGDIKTAKTIWVVLHGYAELASTFVSQFDLLEDQQTAVVAPEGLHRFYRRGFYGDVVASWMTKEDRLNDIQDYIGYLNRLLAQFSHADGVYVLGFSQGVATACRWLAESTVDNLKGIVLWAGTFPTDVDLTTANNSLKQTDVYLCYDEEDPFRTEESWQKQLRFFEQIDIQPHHFKYVGKHAIPKAELQRFLTDLF